MRLQSIQTMVNQLRMILGLKWIPHKTRKRLKKVVYSGMTGVGLIMILSIFYWMLVTSLRPGRELYERPLSYVPSTITFDHYASIFFESTFISFYLNSIIISLSVVLITVVVSTIGGYGLARIDIPYKKTFARGVLFGYMFPPILLAIPMFILWRQIGIIDTYIGLILAETALALPFSLWMMWQFFQTVPHSLEESAIMSGATRFQAFYDIALPMAKPGIIAVAVFTYAVSWNEFTVPKIIMTTPEKWPLTVGVFAFTEGHTVFWGQVMAASFLMIIPSFLFVYFLQKYLLEGFKAGGMT